MFAPMIASGLGALSRIVPAAARGYKAYKTARRVGGLGKFAKGAQPTGGFPLGYQGTAAQRLIGQPKGLGSGTGLSGLTSRLGRKFPTSTGALEAGFGVQAGGQGTSDFITGYQQGDVPQMLSGLGSLGLGATFLGRGSRVLGMSKKLPAGARQALSATGKGFEKRMPKGTGYASLGLIGTGAIGEAAGFGTPDQDPKVISDNPVEIALKAIETDVADPNVDTTTDEYKQIATQVLTNAYQESEQKGIEVEQSLTELTSPYVIKSQAPGSNANKPNEANINTAGLSDEDQMTDGEIAATAKKQENTAKAGEKIKDDINTKASAEEAAQFNEFYNRIQNLTGGNDQTNNLILMKLASGLVSGKTGQSGFRGFLDVLGQAGNETVDTAMALYQKEADRRNTLAVQFLKSKEKTKGGRAVTGSRKRVSVAVGKDVSPWGMATRTVDYFKDDGTTAMFAPVYNEQGKVVGEQAVPMPYGEQKPIQGSAAQEAKLRTQMDNVGLAYQMTQQILEMPDSAYGIGPKLSGFAEDALGSLESIGNTFGMDLGGYSPNTDAKILDEIINAPLIDRTTGEVRSMTEDEADEQREIAKQYKDEVNGILKNFRPGEGSLDQITKAKLIQTRLKYIVANANKAEDRLTQKDIENAEESTQILGWKSPRSVRSAYENLQAQLDKQFEGVGRRYLAAGGSNGYIFENFSHMPFIANWVKERDAQATRKAIENNVMSTIEGIQM